jgi:hypothetical protein
MWRWIYLQERETGWIDKDAGRKIHLIEHNIVSHFTTLDAIISSRVNTDWHWRGGEGEESDEIMYNRNSLSGREISQLSPANSIKRL